MTPSSQLRKARDRFAELLENPNSLEREWEALFTDYPFILTDCLALGIEPAQLIPCRPGKAEADFYFYPTENDPLSRYGVIEIKRPKTAILNTPRKDVIVLSSDAATAVAQAQKYAIELGAMIHRMHERMAILGNRHHIFVIAGMSSEIARKVTTDLQSEQLSRLLPSACRLIPFDSLFESITSRTPPVVHVILPLSTREEGGFRRFGFSPRKMHTTTCTECGKETEVPFKPSAGKPVFCKECYSKKKGVLAMKGQGAI